MRVHGLGHVVLKVRDLNQSVPFYRDVLGLKKVGQDGEKMVFFSFEHGWSLWSSCVWPISVRKFHHVSSSVIL